MSKKVYYNESHQPILNGWKLMQLWKLEMRKKLLLQTYSNVIIRDYSLLFLKCCFNEKNRLNSDVLLLHRDMKKALLTSLNRIYYWWYFGETLLITILN